MKRFLAGNLVALFLLAGFFYWGGVPNAKALSSTNASADLVLGQPDMTSGNANQGQGAHPAANFLAFPIGTWSDGKKLIVADMMNSRVLVYNNIPTENNASADVVIGKPDMNTFSSVSTSASTLSSPYSLFSDGVRLFIADTGNSRVLVYNNIPTANNASADVVIGQPDFTSHDENQGQANAAANTLDYPSSIFSDGKKLFIVDSDNNRVLVYNSIPTTNNANADYVIGQSDLTSNMANRGDDSARSDSFYYPASVFIHSGKLFIADSGNYRVLIYNAIPSASGASANVAVGQTGLGAASDNQGGSAGPNTFSDTFTAHSDGKRLFISDFGNHRLLIYNNIPTSSNANADAVIGQANFTSNSANQSGSAGANTLALPSGIFYAGGELMVGDTGNSRVLLYPLDSSLIWKNKKSVNLYGGIKGKIDKKKISFSGKNANIKKGRVYLYQSGVLKKSAKVSKKGKWKLKYSDSQRSINRTFQLRYYSSSNQFVSVSDPFNIYLAGLNGQTISKYITGQSETVNSVQSPANSESSADNVKKAMEFISSHFKK